MTKLDEHVVIITGAAGGIGGAIARQVVASGGRVVLTDIEESGRAVAEGLGDRAVFATHDVTDESAWDEITDLALEAFGSLTGLVNNAALFERGSLLEATAESLRRMFEVDIIGPFLGMKAFAEKFTRQSFASIVNVSSAAGLRGTGNLVGYTSAKWGVRGLSRAAAFDLAPLGIRVNCLFPGPTNTQMLTEQNTPEHIERIIGKTLLGRRGEPEELARAIAFLLSADASYVVGAELSVDGGIRA